MKENKYISKLEYINCNRYSKRIVFIKIFITIFLNLFNFSLNKKFKSLFIKNNQIRNLKRNINSMLLFKKKIDYSKKFCILVIKCKTCGLFSFYIHYLGCIKIFINKGYIPIIDQNSYPNIFNKFSPNYSNKNPWELYFNQPYGYSLENIRKYAKKKEKFYCRPKRSDRPDKYTLYTIY